MCASLASPARSARPDYWQQKLDEVKNRDVAKASWLKTNWKRAEESGSFAKCMEMWCAKVPRGNVCPRGVSFSSRVWRIRRLPLCGPNGRWTGRQRQNVPGSHRRGCPCRAMWLRQTQHSLGDFARRRTSISLTPLESHISFGRRVRIGVEWKEFSDGKSCGRLEHCRSRWF